MKVILLAAGVGRRLGRAFPPRRAGQGLPKCLIPLGKSVRTLAAASAPTLLSRYLDSFRKLGLKEIVVVCGFEHKRLQRACKKLGRGLCFKFILNPDFKKGSLVSLYAASAELEGLALSGVEGSRLVMDADVYFPFEALRRLLDSPYPDCFLADTRVRSSGEEMMLMARNKRLVSISKKIDPSLDVVGESVGFLKLSGVGVMFLRKILKEFVELGKTDLEYEACYAALMQKIEIRYEKMDGLFWTEMDFAEDLEKILSHRGQA